MYSWNCGDGPIQPHWWQQSRKWLAGIRESPTKYLSNHGRQLWEWYLGCSLGASQCSKFPGLTCSYSFKHIFRRIHVGWTDGAVTSKVLPDNAWILSDFYSIYQYVCVCLTCKYLPPKYTVSPPERRIRILSYQFWHGLPLSRRSRRSKLSNSRDEGWWIVQRIAWPWSANFRKKRTKFQALWASKPEVG